MEVHEQIENIQTLKLWRYKNENMIYGTLVLHV